MPELSIEGPAGRVPAYLARPQLEEPRPAVVVIHDALGLSADIRRQTDRLAAAGYLALAPSLFHPGGLRCVVATMLATRSGRGPAYEVIEAARSWLSAQPGCNGRVGIIGFCMGGGFALQSAPRFGFSAASVNYGEVPADALERLEGTCPMVGSFGRRDPWLKGHADRLEQALTTLGVAHDVKEYPSAGHSFMNHVAVGPLPDRLIQFAHFGYDQAAAEDAWRRILDFFNRHLVGDPTEDGPVAETTEPLARGHLSKMGEEPSSEDRS